MGKITGFKEFERHDRAYDPAEERITHFNEFVQPLPPKELNQQAARCMDCGIPYCHQGCPINNIIPDFNDLVFNNDWEEAFITLDSTNNFPEFTGRICPAPCEAACTLNIDDNPVTIKTIECAIVDKAWEEGWIAPKLPEAKTGKRIAIIGSGPAGMAAAQQLARVGHDVSLYEKHQKIGGLLRYGIPDFKMEKHHIDKRVEQMEAEGVSMKTGVHVGVDLTVKDLRDTYDAVMLAGGAEHPRDLPVPGRDLDGVEFAMDFLPQQNRRVGGEHLNNVREIFATGKHVVVIGGGDTGSDCIGTSFRQNALSVTQIEIMPQPPEKEDKGLTWPNWPMKMRTSSSQAEGAARDWSVMTRSFEGKDGQVTALNCVRVDDNMQDIPGSEFQIKADLVLLAMGFVHPVREGMLEELEGDGLELDGRGNVAAPTTDYATPVPGVFAAGDMRRGQSLVVWAIREGRQAARAVDEFLMGTSTLPR